MAGKGMQLGQSDVYTSYSYSYVWAANQLGHFAIGFVVNLVVLQALGALCGAWLLYYAPCITLVLVLVYVAKEGGDIRKVLRFSGNVLPFKGWSNLWDTVTDISFVVLGAVVSYLPLYRLDLSTMTVGYWVVLVAVVLFVAVLARKPVAYNRRFDASGVPVKVIIYNLKYNFAWAKEADDGVGADESARKYLRRFVLCHHLHPETPRVLALCGGVGSGKTTLAWALATYWSVAGIRAACKGKKDYLFFAGEPDYAKADVVILDDLGEGDALQGEYVQSFVRRCPSCRLVLVYASSERLPPDIPEPVLVQKQNN